MYIEIAFVRPTRRNADSSVGAQKLHVNDMNEKNIQIEF